jgi:hypothetical protein
MRFTFGFPSLAGVLFNLPSLLQFIKWVLDWKGRYDAASSLSDSGRGPMTEFLSYIPPWFYPVALIAGIGLIWWDSKRPKREITVSISPLVAALFVTVLALGTWGWFFYDRSRGPIMWTWDVNLPISLGRSGDFIGVYAFQMKGLNRSDEPITDIKTFVRSNVTGDVMPLKFTIKGQQVDSDKVTVPPEVSFYLLAVIPKEGNGISFDEFKNRFGSFTFTFDYNGGSFIRKFSSGDVEKILANGEAYHRAEHKRVQQMMPGEEPGPRVK